MMRYVVAYVEEQIRDLLQKAYKIKDFLFVNISST